MTKKFELESIEEKKKINDSYSAVFENFIREKEVSWAQSTWGVEGAASVRHPVPGVPLELIELLVFMDVFLLSQLP